MSLVDVLPAVNASLNATSGACLLTGYVFMRRRRIALHRRFMLAACWASIVFLACYVLNHYLRQGIVTRFTATGWPRPLYFSILISHTILAVTIVPLAIWSVINGLKNRVAAHRRVARWTFPLWMYVSVTGVLVYFFLYQWFPPV
jgi:putative membrane protein